MTTKTNIGKRTTCFMYLKMDKYISALCAISSPSEWDKPAKTYLLAITNQFVHGNSLHTFLFSSSLAECLYQPQSYGILLSDRGPRFSSSTMLGYLPLPLDPLRSLTKSPIRHAVHAAQQTSSSLALVAPGPLI